MANTNKTLGTTLTGSNTNILGGNNMKGLLNEKMAELVVEAIAFENENRGFTAKGSQFKSKKESYKRFSNTSDGFNVHNKILVAGEVADIYKEAMEEELEIENIDHRLVGLAAIANSIEKDKKVIEESIRLLDDRKKMKEVEKTQLGDKVFEAYKDYFNKFEEYSSKCVSMFRVVYKNEDGDKQEVLKVVFEYMNAMEFAVEFPLINKEGFFVRNGNRYAAMYTIANKFELLVGTADEIELVHPYSWLVNRLLEIYKTEDGKSVYYSASIFDNIVRFYTSRSNYTNSSLNKKMDKVLNNIKDYAWTDNGISPIIFIEKGNSAVGTYSFSKNILFDFEYDELVQIGHIKGMDFLTGSTSTPAKRCKPAAGWDIVRHGKITKLERISDNDSSVIDYASKFKMSYPAFVKTSAKRDNSATAKDTVNFVAGYEQTYTRKFRTSIVGADLADTTLNKIMKTLWVAKIDLREELPQELVDLHFVPNTNDCFMLNSNTGERMLSVFKKPREEEFSYVKPCSGSKFIGAFRDKGSITGIFNRYMVMVEYKVNNADESTRLIEALKQMRGEDTYYAITSEGNVLFEVDMIANPSTGRDNVAALLTQSCMEQIGILEGREIKMSPAEVGAIDVKKLVTSREFDHRVFVYDTQSGKVVYDFGKTSIILEDFFWQPKHDNTLHCKIKDEVSMKYHQSLDGIRIMLPNLSKALRNSLDLQSIKEDLLLLNMEYKDIKDYEEELNSVNENNDDDNEEFDLL